jgi:4-diphosphocytidyl-2-C-methyl-D-erythritol kinase
MSRLVVIRPPAKINLTLHVGPQRGDGYHDVRTLMQTVALCDTLTVTPRRGPFALATRSPGVPADRTNLIWRAAEVFWRAIGRDGEPRDAHVRLAKQIPPAAGLGGGSADAAAALVALNDVWDARRPRHELIRIASELGADVPFFLFGGTAIAPAAATALSGRRRPSALASSSSSHHLVSPMRIAGSMRTALPATRNRRTHHVVDVSWPTGPIRSRTLQDPCPPS